MSTRVMVLCDDMWHPAEIVRRGLAALGDGFDFEFLENGEAWPRQGMSQFPLTVLAKANMQSSKTEEPWLTPKFDRAFTDYVRCGNGLAVIHAGTARYGELPAMNALVGGAFEGHPEPCEVTIEPVQNHPLTRGVTPFKVCDEHYFMAMGTAPVDVFLQSRSKHGVQPAGWTRVEGEGRVCVLTPGHGAEVWLHPGFQLLLRNALRWAAKMN